MLDRLECRSRSGIRICAAEDHEKRHCDRNAHRKNTNPDATSATVGLRLRRIHDFMNVVFQFHGQGTWRRGQGFHHVRSDEGTCVARFVRKLTRYLRLGLRVRNLIRRHGLHGLGGRPFGHWLSRQFWCDLTSFLRHHFTASRWSVDGLRIQRRNKLHAGGVAILGFFGQRLKQRVVETWRQIEGGLQHRHRKRNISQVFCGDIDRRGAKERGTPT